MHKSVAFAGENLIHKKTVYSGRTQFSSMRKCGKLKGAMTLDLG
jgi:hypothetical protein